MAQEQAKELQLALGRLADPIRAENLRRFFKTGPGEYGAGDRFLGITVPELRAVARAWKDRAGLEEGDALLDSPWHEERLLGLLLWVQAHQRRPEARAAIHRRYLQRADRVNNWDLVDLSAPQLVGTHLLDGDRSVLDRLVSSALLWKRRIAVVSCLAFIRRGESRDIFRLTARLLDDEADLMHKAAGWMLREVGKHAGVDPLRAYLRQYAPRMPRTMLRYAIERLPEPERRRWLSVRRVG